MCILIARDVEEDEEKGICRKSITAEKLSETDIPVTQFPRVVRPGKLAGGGSVSPARVTRHCVARVTPVSPRRESSLSLLFPRTCLTLLATASSTRRHASTTSFMKNRKS